MLKSIKVQNLLCCLILTLICNQNLSAKPATTPAKPTQKTVLVTGGLSGIGKEISVKFRDAGWDVWATSRNPIRYRTITGINVRKLEDITDSVKVTELLEEIKAKSGRLDVLVNNAAFAVLGPTETMSSEQARKVLDVNVIAPLQFIQASLPIMRAQKNGHIINISSTSGLRTLPGLSLYGASKMALEGLSEGLAAEVAQWNIHVSIVEPGSVNNTWAKNAPSTDNLKNYPGYSKFTHKLRSTLNKKAQDGQNPEEIANLIFEIANNPKPDLRYQTNPTVAALAQEILTDPTGNRIRDKTISFAREMYQQF